METFELRYFTAVAATENIHRAAEAVAVSPASLSKAIARLENELGVKLFERIRRNIRLTHDGRLLQERAAAILRLEEATRVELQGGRAGLTVRIAGPEILLAQAGPAVAQAVLAQHPKARFRFYTASEEEAERAVVTGEAQLGVTTGTIASKLTAKKMFEVEFKTVVGRGHPLFSAAKAGKTVPVENVLQHAFVSPDRPIMGLIGKRQSPDGWRDDKFPRRIAYVADSLKLVEELVTRGDAVAYLPDYFVARIDAVALKISGCPYACTQTARLFAKDPAAAGWMHRLF